MPESYATRIAAKQAALSRSMLEHSQGSRFNEQSPSFETESSKILVRPLLIIDESKLMSFDALGSSRQTGGGRRDAQHGKLQSDILDLD